MIRSSHSILDFGWELIEASHDHSWVKPITAIRLLFSRALTLGYPSSPWPPSNKVNSSAHLIAVQRMYGPYDPYLTYTSYFSSVRFIVFDRYANVVAQAQAEFPQYYPQPGFRISTGYAYPVDQSYPDGMSTMLPKSRQLLTHALLKRSRSWKSPVGRRKALESLVSSHPFQFRLQA